MCNDDLCREAERAYLTHQGITPLDDGHAWLDKAGLHAVVGAVAPMLRRAAVAEVLRVLGDQNGYFAWKSKHFPGHGHGSNEVSWAHAYIHSHRERIAEGVASCSS